LSILCYNNKLFRASRDFIFTTRLSILIVTSYRKIQKEQEKYNKLIIFFATSLILTNSITSKFRKENLKNLTTNKKQQIEVSILINNFVQN